MGKRGEYQYVPSKVICLTVSKNFVGEPFRVSLISRTEKVYEYEGGGLSRSSVESFLPHSAEIFRRMEPSSVSLISGIKIFYASESYVTILDFLSKFFSPTVPKIFVGELLSAVF